ncbi:MAG: nitroreductase family deazaflavin-dependent oxidoreductase [Deltaproteobacteria bacterium]
MKDKSGFLKDALAWYGSTRVGAWTIINLGSHLDKWLIKASGGRLNTTFAWPCLVLTTKGARTGRPRTTPLVYIEDGGNIVLIASKRGNPSHPSWYINLRANPEVEVFLGGETKTCTATDAEGEERERLWQKAVKLYSGYEKYRKRAGERQIPVVVLKPL